MTVVGPYTQEDFQIMKLLKKHIAYMSKDVERYSDMLSNKIERMNNYKNKVAA
jgi:hypothetical protein